MFRLVASGKADAVVEELHLGEYVKLTEQHLAETLNTIKTALQTSENPEKENAEDMPEIKPVAVDIDSELEAIVKRVEDYDSTAEEAVEALLEKVDDPELRISLDQLKHHLDDYDFDATASCLTEIEKRRLRNE